MPGNRYNNVIGDLKRERGRETGEGRGRETGEGCKWWINGGLVREIILRRNRGGGIGREVEKNPYVYLTEH